MDLTGGIVSTRQKRQDEPAKRKTSLFTCFANHTAKAAGHHLTFTLAVVVIVVWAVTGPVFGFSDTWQLVINTGTTIVTFLMVFLIQNTQNRDSTAMHLKLDELIRATRLADNSLLNLEELEESELELLRLDYEKLAETARSVLSRKRSGNQAAKTQASRK